ncbi:hypothetical protein C6Q04_18875 [Burkholderia multivorans]|nr:hypothetical protein WM33_12655 [Burkholderia multivorans]KVZ84589.1 hypothetical protein WL23_05895 [Burkholderia multivorans]PRF47163.1 hypothetical protein C6Q04_18875 [Burkholderia multivorans]
MQPAFLIELLPLEPGYCSGEIPLWSIVTELIKLVPQIIQFVVLADHGLPVPIKDEVVQRSHTSIHRENARTHIDRVHG